MVQERRGFALILAGLLLASGHPAQAGTVTYTFPNAGIPSGFYGGMPSGTGNSITGGASDNKVTNAALQLSFNSTNAAIGETTVANFGGNVSISVHVTRQTGTNITGLLTQLRFNYVNDPAASDNVAWEELDGSSGMDGGIRTIGTSLQTATNGTSSASGTFTISRVLNAGGALVSESYTPDGGGSVINLMTNVQTDYSGVVSAGLLVWGTGTGTADFDTLTITADSIPEPSALMVIGGVAGIVCRTRFGRG